MDRSKSGLKGNGLVMPGGLEEAFLNDEKIGAASDAIPELNNTWSKEVLTLGETKEELGRAQKELIEIVLVLMYEDHANAGCLVEVGHAIYKAINFLEHIDKILKEIQKI